MSKSKKLVRENFRNSVFERDGHVCAIPGCTETENLDAHHITDRTHMPFGGYVKENGISLCEEHHKDAEVFHSTGVALDGFSPSDLYKLIGSSLTLATQKSKSLA
jgi:predicted restriction endonuclease